MHVTPLAWGITIVVILGLFVFDFFASNRTATYDSVAFRFIAANEHPDHDQDQRINRDLSDGEVNQHFPLLRAPSPR